MASLFQIADSVMVTLGMTHDDAIQNRISVANKAKMVIDVLRDRIIKHSVESDERQVSDMLLIREVDVVPNTYNTTIPFDCMYFDLPVGVYSLPGDAGMAWVRYSRNGLPPNCPPQLARTVFTRTYLGALSALWDMVYEDPCDSRPYFARDDKRVYVFGVQPQVSKLLIGIYAQLPDFTTIDPNENVNIPAEYLMAVEKMTVDMLRNSLMLPERLRIDGRDLDQPMRTDRMTSINDPANLTDV